MSNPSEEEAALDRIEEIRNEACQNPNSTRISPHLPRLLAEAERLLQRVSSSEGQAHARAWLGHIRETLT